MPSAELLTTARETARAPSRRRKTVGPIVLRVPGVDDGADMWALAKAAGGLDVNSPYAYLLLCRNFANTCVLAQTAGRPIGFLTAFRAPEDDSVLFVWQVAVLPECRGRGVASAMLRRVLARSACTGVRFVEATVTDDNSASRALFERCAAERAAACTQSSGFPRELFPDRMHDSERLLRVGPLS